MAAMDTTCLQVLRDEHQKVERNLTPNRRLGFGLRGLCHDSCSVPTRKPTCIWSTLLNSPVFGGGLRLCVPLNKHVGSRIRSCARPFVLHVEALSIVQVLLTQSLSLFGVWGRAPGFHHVVHGFKTRSVQTSSRVVRHRSTDATFLTCYMVRLQHPFNLSS